MNVCVSCQRFNRARSKRVFFRQRVLSMRVYTRLRYASSWRNGEWKSTNGHFLSSTTSKSRQHAKGEKFEWIFDVWLVCPTLTDGQTDRCKWGETRAEKTRSLPRRRGIKLSKFNIVKSRKNQRIFPHQPSFFHFSWTPFFSLSLLFFRRLVSVLWHRNPSPILWYGDKNATAASKARSEWRNGSIRPPPVCLSLSGLTEWVSDLTAALRLYD